MKIILGYILTLVATQDSFQCCKNRKDVAKCDPVTGECKLTCAKTMLCPKSYCFAAIRFHEIGSNSKKLAKKVRLTRGGLLEVPAYSTCVEQHANISNNETSPAICKVENRFNDCYCASHKCNRRVFLSDTTQLNNLVESLTRYRNEPAYVSPTPSTMVIPSDQDFGQVYGQGDQGILLPNPGIMIAAVLISMSVSSLILLLLAFLYFHLARLCGWHKSLFRTDDGILIAGRSSEDDHFLQTNRAGKVTVIEDGESYCSNRSSRDSGVPTTINHENSTMMESRSTYQQALSPQSYNDLVFDSVIGQGRFSTVWKCSTGSKQTVCVKEFHQSESASWRQERSIISSPLYQSKFVIELLSSEVKNQNGKKKMWLILPYYKNGDLQQFLKTEPLTLDRAINLSLSICMGVEFIHSSNDAFGCQRFPLAHRDIKSANVLVADNGNEAILADFGLSIRLTDDITKKSICQAGTSRYMSPEILDRYANINNIQSFLSIDIYALSLVLWEILNRTSLNDNHKPEYVAPYAHLVNDQPSKEMMRSIVSRYRPEVRECYSRDDHAIELVRIITLGWDKDPEARISAASMVNRLKNLINRRTL